MSKQLTIDRMLEAALDSEMPGAAQFIEQAENLATILARNLATHLNVETQEAIWQGRAFGGTCARFGPTNPSQPCPDVIHAGDVTGDWELLSSLVMHKSTLRPGGLQLASDEPF